MHDIHLCQYSSLRHRNFHLLFGNLTRHDICFSFSNEVTCGLNNFTSLNSIGDRSCTNMTLTRYKKPIYMLAVTIQYCSLFCNIAVFTLYFSFYSFFLFLTVLFIQAFHYFFHQQLFKRFTTTSYQTFNQVVRHLYSITTVTTC